MFGAFAWGFLAAATLIAGGAFSLHVGISGRTLGLVMGFGGGVLISAVAFDLVEEAVNTATEDWSVIVGIFAGCGVFFGGDWLIDRSGGEARKDAGGDQASVSPLAIVLGTVLDGVPESAVIGLTIFEGGAVGAAYLTAVFISNLPESISSTAGLARSGWSQRVIWRNTGAGTATGIWS